MDKFTTRPAPGSAQPEGFRLHPDVAHPAPPIHKSHQEFLYISPIEPSRHHVHRVRAEAEIVGAPEVATVFGAVAEWRAKPGFEAAAKDAHERIAQIYRQVAKMNA